MNTNAEQPEIPDDHPMHAAIQKADVAAVRHYLDSGISPYTLGLISGAIGSGNVEIVQSFLDHGLDLNQPFSPTAGTIPIIRTIEKKQMGILKLLVEKGATVGLNPYALSTPLHTAAGIWPEAVPFLLEAGADVNARSNTGRTPLMSAAHRNQIQSLEFLIEAGGNLEAQDNEGTTPLILAARAGKVEAATWLLDHGADILAEDNDGKSAEDWARENGHRQVVELIQSRMGS